MHVIDLRQPRGCNIDSEEAMPKAMSVVKKSEEAVHIPVLDRKSVV